MNEYLDLFLTFSKIGVLTFGGGMAMLPMLQREIVDNKAWATEEELMDYYAIGQCTPGIIAVNTATFVGRKRKGTLGGIAASLGMVAPSLVIIILIAALLSNFADIVLVQKAFKGIRLCVCGLILSSLAKFYKKNCKDKASKIICSAVAVVSIVASQTFNRSISPVIFVIAAALAGMFICEFREIKAQGEKQKKEEEK